jgi:energy-coupling factor transport system substrate-specific component
MERSTTGERFGAESAGHRRPSNLIRLAPALGSRDLRRSCGTDTHVRMPRGRLPAESSDPQEATRETPRDAGTVGSTGGTGGTGGTPLRGGTVLASRPLNRWRTVDLLTITFLGAALGSAFWGWGQFYNGPITALKIGFPPAMGLFMGPWLLAGVIGGLVVRRPGAALFCEVVAALVSMLPGTEWGATTLMSGILQGLGAELAFALLGYRAFGAAAASLAGVLSVPLEWAFETFKAPAAWADLPVVGPMLGGGAWYGDWSFGYKLAYLGCMSLSGIVLAGILGWVLTRALARAGALGALPPGQELREARAV